MWPYAEEVGKAEDKYLTQGPPVSPLTTSYFTSWAFFDHRIGGEADTLARCLIDANDVIGMNPDQLGALALPTPPDGLHVAPPRRSTGATAGTRAWACSSGLLWEAHR